MSTVPDIFAVLFSDRDITNLRCTCRQLWLVVGKRFRIVEKRVAKRARIDELFEITTRRLFNDYEVLQEHNDIILRFREIGRWCDICRSPKFEEDVCECGLCENCGEESVNLPIYVMTNTKTTEEITICSRCRYDDCWHDWIDDEGDRICNRSVCDECRAK